MYININIKDVYQPCECPGQVETFLFPSVCTGRLDELPELVILDPVIRDPVILDPVILTPVILDPVILDPVILTPVIRLRHDVKRISSTVWS